MVKLGGLSYSLYLIHEPMIWLSLSVAERYFHIDQGSVGNIAIVGRMSIPLSFLAANALHHLVEIPVINVGKDLARRRNEMRKVPIN